MPHPTPAHLAPADPRRWRRRALPAAIAVAVAGLGLVAVTGSGDGVGGDDLVAGPGTDATPSTSTTTHPTTTSTTVPTPAPPPPAIGAPAPATTAPPPAATVPPAPAAAPVVDGAALCVGDSVMLGASPQYLGTLTMCGTVDAALSRQFSSAPATVAAHAPYPSTVVIHLGNNGTVDRGDVDAVMAELAAVPRVVFVTVQLNGTRSWEAQANGEIRAAARYPNVAIADWKGASDGHPDDTREDGIHMSPAGGGVYAATIAAAL